MPPVAPADRTILDREQAEVLHGEVDRLPRAFRLPVVLCYFEGLTLDEAARPAAMARSARSAAGWPGRERSSGPVWLDGAWPCPPPRWAVVLAPRSASASVPPLLCDSTTRAAIAFAARHAAASGALSASTAALAQEVLRTMLFHKLRLVAMTMLALAAIATGAGYLAHSLNASALPREGEAPREPSPHPARREARPPDAPIRPEGADDRRRPRARSRRQAGPGRGR